MVSKLKCLVCEVYVIWLIICFHMTVPICQYNKKRQKKTEKVKRRKDPKREN